MISGGRGVNRSGGCNNLPVCMKMNKMDLGRASLVPLDPPPLDHPLSEKWSCESIPHVDNGKLRLEYSTIAPTYQLMFDNAKDTDKCLDNHW